MIRLDDVKRHKRCAINEQSNGLLEIIDTGRGFDAIGGSDDVVIPSFWRTYRVSYSKLEEQILGYRVQLGLIRRIEGGSA